MLARYHRTAALDARRTGAAAQQMVTLDAQPWLRDPYRSDGIIAAKAGGSRAAPTARCLGA